MFVVYRLKESWGAALQVILLVPLNNVALLVLWGLIRRSCTSGVSHTLVWNEWCNLWCCRQSHMMLKERKKEHLRKGKKLSAGWLFLKYKTESCSQNWTSWAPLAPGYCCFAACAALRTEGLRSSESNESCQRSEHRNAAGQKSFADLWFQLLLEAKNVQVQRVRRESGVRGDNDGGREAGSRQSKLPENVSGERKEKKPAVNVWQLLRFCRVTWAAHLLWGQDPVDRKGDILSFPADSHPTIICVHRYSVQNRFWWILFLCFIKTVVCFPRKWTLQKVNQRSATRGAVAPTLTWNAWTLIYILCLMLVYRIYAVCIS